jgi:hypothetical protein
MPQLAARFALVITSTVSTAVVRGDGGSDAAAIDVQFLPDQGRVKCSLVCPDGQAWSVVEIGPLAVDQIPQQDFAPTAGDDKTWINGSAAVEFEAVSPRSHAIT